MLYWCKGNTDDCQSSIVGSISHIERMDNGEQIKVI